MPWNFIAWLPQLPLLLIKPFYYHHRLPVTDLMLLAILFSTFFFSRLFLTNAEYLVSLTLVSIPSILVTMFSQLEARIKAVTNYRKSPIKMLYANGLGLSQLLHVLEGGNLHLCHALLLFLHSLGFLKPRLKFTFLKISRKLLVKAAILSPTSLAKLQKPAKLWLSLLT